jgi:hypothetical protein
MDDDGKKIEDLRGKPVRFTSKSQSLFSRPTLDETITTERRT